MKRLDALVDEINRCYTRPGLLLALHGPQKLDAGWRDGWMFSDKQGVYAFVDGNRHVLYVGSAMQSFGLRFGNWWKRGPGGGPVFLDAAKYGQMPMFKNLGPIDGIVYIPLPESRAWESLSIERFLIERRNPPGNTHGTPEPSTSP